MSAISLGVPTKAPDVRGKNQMHMTATTIGGLPFCRDVIFFDTHWPLLCKNCKNPMNFISQVYAPIGDCDRSLYIFGCNSGACYKVNKASWRCLRWQENTPAANVSQTQHSSTSHTAPTSKKGDETTDTAYLSTQIIQKNDTPPATDIFSAPAWDIAKQSGDQHNATTESCASKSVDQWDVSTDLDPSSAFGESEWSASGASDWGASDWGNAEAAPAKQLEVIDKVDVKDGLTSPPLPPQKTASGSNPKTIKGNLDSVHISCASKSVDQWDVSTDLDPSSAFGESEWSASGASDWGNAEAAPAKQPEVIDKVDLKDGLTSPPLPPQKTASGSNAKTIKSNLDSTHNTAWDIDPGAHGMQRFECFRSRFLVHTYDEPYRHDKRAKANVAEEVFDRDNTGGEAYERPPPALDAAIKFQKRLARLPQQCMRYAYGTAPLWPCPPMALKVPPCPSCGAQRAFEMQLMPATLFQLGVPLDGMEWGSVLIFSCPDSCPSSMEEFAVSVPID